MNILPVNSSFAIDDAAEDCKRASHGCTIAAIISVVSCLSVLILRLTCMNRSDHQSDVRLKCLTLVIAMIPLVSTLSPILQYSLGCVSEIEEDISNGNLDTVLQTTISWEAGWLFYVASFAFSTVSFLFMLCLRGNTDSTDRVKSRSGVSDQVPRAVIVATIAEPADVKRGLA